MKFFTKIFISLILFFLTIPAFAGNSIQGPTLGRITSNFGYRPDPFTGVYKLHHGLDIAAPLGSPVYSLQEGIVNFTGRKGGYGNAVIVNHFFNQVPELPNVKTLYGHLSRIYVKEGDYVVRGQVLGTIGSTGRSTGPHLHYEAYYKGNNIDPIEYLQKLPGYLEYANKIRQGKSQMAGANYSGQGGR